ncbi:hypothetical protein SUDANB150_07635 [Streptomyces sp. enrichment culture]
MGPRAGGMNVSTHRSTETARRRVLRSSGSTPARVCLLGELVDAEAYKQRNTVERCIGRLKQWRGLAMRTNKLALAYRAALHLAAILMWARR